MKDKKVKIVENSIIAQIAGIKLKAPQVAVTIGNKIHICKTKKEDFLNDTKWLRHELKHVEQYQRMGFWKFLYEYLRLSLKHGYYQNPLEIEARLPEIDDDIIDRHEIMV